MDKTKSHHYLPTFLRPFLQKDLVDVTKENLLQCLKPPLVRLEFDTAIECFTNGEPASIEEKLAMARPQKMGKKK